MNLRSGLIRLASSNPELRGHLLPLLKSAAGTMLKITVPGGDGIFPSALQQIRSEENYTDMKDYKIKHEIVWQTLDEIRFKVEDRDEQLSKALAEMLISVPVMEREEALGEVIKYCIDGARALKKSRDSLKKPYMTREEFVKWHNDKYPDQNMTLEKAEEFFDDEEDDDIMADGDTSATGMGFEDRDDAYNQFIKAVLDFAKEIKKLKVDGRKTDYLEFIKKYLPSYKAPVNWRN